MVTESRFMDVISDRTDVLKILPEAAAELCTALFRNSPAGIYITRDGKFIYTNIEFRRITGYSQDELSGKDYMRLINPRYRQRPKQNAAFLLPEDDTTGHEFKITTHEGKKKWISEKITYFKYGGNWLTLGHWLDISEHHSIEKAWHEAERRFQAAFEDLSTGLSIIGTDGIFLKVNKSFCDMIGYEEQEILESRFDQVLCPEDRAEKGDLMQLFLSLEKPDKLMQMRLECKDGRAIWVSMSISLIGDSEDGPSYFIVNFQDVTEQKRIEQGLKEEEKLYRSLVDMALEHVAVADLDCRFTHASQKFVEQMGYSSEKDLLGKTIGGLVVPAESQMVQASVMDLLKQDRPGSFDCSLVKKDGSAFRAAMNISWINNSQGSPSCIVVRLLDKTAERPHPAAAVLMEQPAVRAEAPAVIEPKPQAVVQVPEPAQPGPEQKVEEPAASAAPAAEETAAPAAAVAAPPEEAAPAEKHEVEQSPMAQALENTSTAIMLINDDTKIAAVNAAFERLTGLSREETEGKKSWIEFVAAEDQPRLKKYYLLRRLDPASAPDTYEFKLVDRQGNTKDVLINVSPVAGTKMLAASMLDITDYHRESKGETFSEQYKYQQQVVGNLKSMVFILGMDLKLLWVNPFGTKRRGFSVDELMSMPLDRQVTADTLQRALKILEEELKLEKAGTADPDRYRKIELEFYNKDGSTYWSENIFSGIRDDKGELIGLLSEGRDISNRKRSEDLLERSLAMLERTLLSVIEAMARVVEMKDPYTAGHQERVAELSRAIAVGMNLPDDLVQGITLAAKIHDIGKVYVPVEILSKPVVLTGIEREIIKAHARGSYDILKSIEFPWPVAESVYQHHERMDGSGYPRGLKEHEIILEAKIIMVADVVEAMASYRPYRPACGIDAALDEISANSGILYDPEVVKTCVRLFREEGFCFKEPTVAS